MKQKSIKIIPKNDAEWLKIKKGTLGGSEIAAAIGLNPYFSPRELWLIKTGKKEFVEPTIQMKRGNCFEDGLVKLWEMETGHLAIKSSAKNILYIDPEYPFLSCTPDRLFFYKGNRKDKRTLEVKTTFGRYEDPLDQWLIQLSWETMLTGTNMGEILWEYPNPSVCFKSNEYEANKDLQEQLKEFAINWWTEFIINDKEPPLMTVNDIIDKFPQEQEGKILEASENIADYYSEAKQIQEVLKSNEEELEKYKLKFQLFMTDAEKITYAGQTLCTWKANKNGTRVFRIC